MVGRGGTTQRFAGVLAGTALVLAVTGCRAALQPSASPPTSSSTASPSLAPTTSPVANLPSQAASPTGTAIPTSDPRSDSFAILPGTQPADYDLHGMSCSGSIGAQDPVAVVQLHSTGTFPDTVLRDYADVAHPRTVCELGLIGMGLIDAHHGLIDNGTGGAIVDLPALRFHWFALPGGLRGPGRFIAISPALDQIVWMTADPEGTATDTVHITTAAGDRVLATLRDTNAGRCGSPDDSRPGEFTPSGKHLYVLNAPLQTQASLLVVEAGKVVFSVLPPTGDWPENGWPAMAVWSPTGETLYYRQGTDVWKWTSGSTAQKFLSGVKWYDPTISPDGAHLAYAVDIPNSLHDVYVVDLAHGGSPQKIGPGAHNFPVFLNNSQLWLMAESLNTGCADENQLKPMVYNVISGTEAPSIIDWVVSAWPATSSNW